MKKDINIQNTYVYQTYPDDKLQHPGLILIEEIWGVNDHLKEVADRFVKEGFNILVPELLPKGLLELLVPKFQEDIFDPEKRDEVQPKLRAAMQPQPPRPSAASRASRPAEPHQRVAVRAATEDRSW